MPLESRYQMMYAERCKRIVSAKIFIDRHYEQPIDLMQIAAEACISPYHFLRLFKKTYHCTPHRYLTRKRLGKAKLLLADQNLSIADICSMIGFESAGSFSLLFRKYNGLNPAAYREQVQRKIMLALDQPSSLVPHCFISTFGAGSGQ
jgi:AraC-like DNA-binding protein